MKKQILAVDDDSSIRELLEFLLRNNYNVITKKDGMEAMMWLSEGNIPDLIITDIDMPRLNGYEFFRADDYILKPFNPESLYAKIERVLNHTNVSANA